MATFNATSEEIRAVRAMTGQIIQAAGMSLASPDPEHDGRVDVGPLLRAI